MAGPSKQRGGDVEALITHRRFPAEPVAHHDLGLLGTGTQGAAIGHERPLPHLALQHPGAVGQDVHRGRIERNPAQHLDRIRGRQRIQSPWILGHAPLTKLTLDEMAESQRLTEHEPKHVRLDYLNKYLYIQSALM